MGKIKRIRLPHYDYSSNGFYFVTIMTNYRQPYLKDRYDIIKHAIENLNQTQGVMVDYYVIMDNHVHLILILNDCELRLGEIVRRLKAITSKESGLKLWQPNYYEHVIRNDIALEKIREYIVNNPLIERIEFEQFYTR
jgi:putative transposase